MENIIDYFTFGVVQLREILQVNALHEGLFYYNTPNDMEINFVIETNRGQQDREAAVVCIKVKLSEKWGRAFSGYRYHRSPNKYEQCRNPENNGDVDQ
jgi:hypothetical protein